jgi:hypothetical protein
METQLRGAVAVDMILGGRVAVGGDGKKPRHKQGYGEARGVCGVSVFFAMLLDIVDIVLVICCVRTFLSTLKCFRRNISGEIFPERDVQSLNEMVFLSLVQPTCTTKSGHVKQVEDINRFYSYIMLRMLTYYHEKYFCVLPCIIEIH